MASDFVSLGKAEPWVDRSEKMRMLYSQDASIFQQRPAGVCQPRTVDELQAVVVEAHARNVPLIPRGGGTSLAGQCVGRGIVLDTSRHMRAIRSIDAVNRRAVVEPGVVLADLNDILAPDGLRFAPDTSTSRQAVLGGMIGNNSCGSASVRYGTTREHVESMRLLLADGTRLEAAPLPKDVLADRLARNTREGALLRGLIDRIMPLCDAIRTQYPDPAVLRRNTGYAFDEMIRRQPFDPAGPPFSLVPLLCGSEGTLALTLEATLRLVPSPGPRRVLVLSFDSVEAACDAVAEILSIQPAAIELLDHRVMEASRNHRLARHGWPGGVDKWPAVLLVELHADHGGPDLEARGRELCERRLPTLASPPRTYHACTPAEAERAWGLRREGLGVLAGIPGDAKPTTAIEDLAVPPTVLGAFVREIRELLEEMGLECVFYGHASVGLLHLRPLLNLKEPRDAERFHRLLQRATHLVRRYGGSLSGEHGDGRLRSPLHPEFFSEEIIALHRDVKTLFDPGNILNPGTITQPRPLSEAWRTPPGQATPEVHTEFDWRHRHGLVRAVESCNGSGFCRQSAGRGTMCPTYMATGDEALSTRGRANILRHLFTAEDTDAIWTAPEVHEVLATCIACKGCATECPASVDMARIKAEVLQKRYDRVPAPLRDRLLGHFARQARRVSKAPRLSAWVLRQSFTKKMLGLAPNRSLPALARTRFSAWWSRQPPLGQGRQPVILLLDEVTEYLEPQVGIAAVRVLTAAGFEVRPTAVLDSGRSQISKGFLRDARACIEAALDHLHPAAEKGLPIIGLEPSAALGFRDEAPDLVSTKRKAMARAVAGSVFLFDEWMAQTHGDTARESLTLASFNPAQILLHSHCHQKAIAGPDATVACLKRIPGAEVKALRTGCCGMAGSFGLEREHAALSLDIAETSLFPALRENPEAWICAPGVSCRQQIRDGLGRRAYHPAELLALAAGHPV